MEILESQLYATPSLVGESNPWQIASGMNVKARKERRSLTGKAIERECASMRGISPRNWGSVLCRDAAFAGAIVDRYDDLLCHRSRRLAKLSGTPPRAGWFLTQADLRPGENVARVQNDMAGGGGGPSEGLELRWPAITARFIKCPRGSQTREPNLERDCCLWLWRCRHSRRAGISEVGLCHHRGLGT